MRIIKVTRAAEAGGRTKGRTVLPVPANLRSKLAFCPIGQMGGYLVRTRQLVEFARLLGREMIDEVIPLDDSEQARPESCPSGNHEGDSMIDNLVYWETEDGSHGWCCKECGTVVQWG
jgi:hypothetical protein